MGLRFGAIPGSRTRGIDESSALASDRAFQSGADGFWRRVAGKSERRGYAGPA